MTAYTDALEAFNRATHPDALRELQIVPAEELQADLPLHGATIPLWMIPATAAFTFLATIIGVNTL